MDNTEQPPCLIVAHRRLEPLKLVVDAVIKCGITEVLVVIDGPRSEEERRQIDAVEEFVHGASWPGHVDVHRRSENRGVGYSVPEACDEFFSTRESGIILEDDCVPTREFVQLSQLALARYEQDRSVALISGNRIANPRKSRLRTVSRETPLRRSRYPLIWGWATWRDRWRNYHLVLDGWRKQVPLHTLAMRLGGLVPANDWRRLFNACAVAPPPAWSYQVAHMMLARNQFAVLPSIDLVENVGFGGGASNTHSTPDYAPSVPPQHIREEWLSHAQDFMAGEELPVYSRKDDRLLARQVWSPPLFTRARGRLDRVMRG